VSAASGGLTRLGGGPLEAKRRAETGRLITVQPSPLVIVTAFDGDQVAGCLVSFHTHVSVVPHRYMVCLARTNHTFAVAQAAQHLGIHLLESRHKETAKFFGATSGFTTRKLVRHPWQSWRDGTPILEEIGCWMVGVVRSLHELGDHVGFVVDVVDSQLELVGDVLTVHDLGTVIPGHPL
jgi:flavin reductase (DIM6/NTAB) family NADH-FMN oxidoreductase RutF